LVHRHGRDTYGATGPQGNLASGVLPDACLQDLADDSQVHVARLAANIGQQLLRHGRTD